MKNKSFEYSILEKVSKQISNDLKTLLNNRDKLIAEDIKSRESGEPVYFDGIFKKNKE